MLFLVEIRNLTSKKTVSDCVEKFHCSSPLLIIRDYEYFVHSHVHTFTKRGAILVANFRQLDFLEIYRNWRVGLFKVVDVAMENHSYHGCTSYTTQRTLRHRTHSEKNLLSCALTLILQFLPLILKVGGFFEKSLKLKTVFAECPGID